MKKQRIDLLLVARGLAESRSQAQRYVMAGQVRVNDQVVPKPSSLVEPDAELSLDLGSRYVSRGGEKLAAALAAFPVNPAGKICADVGASTGGFTDCLLQHGAAKVYAIDVGYGLIHWKLRNDPRVVLMERTNARHLEALPDPVALVTMDAAFISARLLIPAVKTWMLGQGDLIALVKPQFEAGRREAARGQGVVRDPEIHRRVLVEVLQSAEAEGFSPLGLIRSPVTGPKGNVEFLAWLQLGGGKGEPIEELVEVVEIV